MNVPRGTIPLLERTRGNMTDSFKLRRWRSTPEERNALAVGAMTTARWRLEAANCAVEPGTFEGLDMESGRAKRSPGAVALRARCRFESGGVRVVTVSPTIRTGDVFWVGGIGAGNARKVSKFTIEVDAVDIARLQDMTDADALACGAACALDRFKITGTPRDWFARSWNRSHYPHQSWSENEWVWVVRFKTYRRNVDDLLREWGARE